MKPTQAQPTIAEKIAGSEPDELEEARADYEREIASHLRRIRTLESEVQQVTAQRDELQIRLRHADEAVLHIAKQRDDLKAAIRDALSQRSSSRLLRAAIQKAEAK